MCRNTPYPPPINDDAAYNVTCDITSNTPYKGQCSGTIIECPDNADCNVACSGDNSCSGSVIHCPTNGKCNVECTGSNACSNAIVYWSQVNHSYASLLCPSGGSQCNDIRLPQALDSPWNDQTWTHWCNTPYYCASAIINCPTDGDCIVNCLGDNACTGSTINCPINGECHIVCDGSYSCKYGVFNGPIDKKFTIYCDGTYSCFSAVIYAQHSSYFNFTMGYQYNSYYTARATTFYFPPKNGSIPRAFLLILDEFGFNGNDGYEPQQFYALHGWEDVSVDFPGGISALHGGIMHCNVNYTDSCLFADDSWQCISTNTICDNPILATMSPTESPLTTSSPSSNEPTKSPSENPSVSPTESSIPPTYGPTLEPTILPTTSTTNPTIDPMMNETSDPTVNPTTLPTSIPSSIPTIDPTVNPTTIPTNIPSTKDQTVDPSYDPTIVPTHIPSDTSSIDPSEQPTKSPTFDPSTFPTNSPFEEPTAFPTRLPSQSPEGISSEAEASNIIDPGSTSFTIIIILASVIVVTLVCGVIICCLIYNNFNKKNEQMSAEYHIQRKHDATSEPPVSEMVHLSSNSFNNVGTDQQQQEALKDGKNKDANNDSDDMYDDNINSDLEEQKKAENDDVAAMYTNHKDTSGENNETNDEQKEGKVSTDYLNWNHEDIFNWIMSLESDRFRKYENVLKQSLFEEELKGPHLVDVDKTDIHRWGIKPFEDKQKLYTFIRELIMKAEEHETPML